MFNVAKDNALYSMCQEFGRSKSILPIMVSTSSSDLRGNGVLYRYLSYARLYPGQPPTDLDGRGRRRERSRRRSDGRHRDNGSVDAPDRRSRSPRERRDSDSDSDSSDSDRSLCSTDGCGYVRDHLGYCSEGQSSDSESGSSDSGIESNNDDSI